MPTVLPIVKYGQRILEEEADVVMDINEPYFQTLVDDMIATYEDANGLGIAGPQVNVGYRVFVISARPCSLYPDAPHFPATPMFNPVITERSSRMMTNWETCLSIPNVFGQVPRHNWIRVSYTDRHGHRVRRILRGFLARVFQHELDHLDGILFLSRVEPKQTFTREEYEQKVAEVPLRKHA